MRSRTCGEAAAGGECGGCCAVCRGEAYLSARFVCTRLCRGEACLSVAVCLWRLVYCFLTGKKFFCALREGVADGGV